MNTSAGLLACGSQLAVGLPEPRRIGKGSVAYSTAARRLQLRGQLRNWARARTAFPILRGKPETEGAQAIGHRSFLSSEISGADGAYCGAAGGMRASLPGHASGWHGLRD